MVARSARSSASIWVMFIAINSSWVVLDRVVPMAPEQKHKQRGLTQQHCLKTGAERAWG